MSTPSSSIDSTSMLARWQAEEAAVLARAMETGVARPDQVAGMTGLQMFEAMLAGQLPRAPITEMLGFMLIEAR
jgi:hypothetical protein